MPKLTLFAACEKVIIDQDNNPSLIALLTDLTTDIPEPDEQADKRRLVAAIRWSILSMWERADDELDDHQEYHQRIALFDPSGEHAGLEVQNTWKFGEKTSMRNLGVLSGFPVYMPGRYMLKMWMQKQGDQEDADPIAVYKIGVKFSGAKA